MRLAESTSDFGSHHVEQSAAFVAELAAQEARSRRGRVLALRQVTREMREGTSEQRPRDATPGHGQPGVVDRAEPLERGRIGKPPAIVAGDPGSNPGVAQRPPPPVEVSEETGVSTSSDAFASTVVAVHTPATPEFTALGDGNGSGCVGKAANGDMVSPAVVVTRSSRTENSGSAAPRAGITRGCDCGGTGVVLRSAGGLRDCSCTWSGR